MLLEESHLELVEDVLKETNFNFDDWQWPKLGEKLGLHHDELLERIYPENSSNLKECLRKWLRSPDAAGYPLLFRPLPTLDGLAAALDSIGYSEAAEYIIKTCKLIIMFNDQCY